MVVSRKVKFYINSKVLYYLCSSICKYNDNVLRNGESKYTAISNLHKTSCMVRGIYIRSLFQINVSCDDLLDNLVAFNED
jgi:hypothetical protein